MNKRLILASVVFCAVAVAFCGCQPKAPYSLVPIKGVATYKGEPLPVGFRVQFEPADGSRESFGNIQEGGSFEVIHTGTQKGVKPGPCKIRVYWNDPPEVNPVPEGYEEMMAKYGMTGTAPIEMDIQKKNDKLEVKFE